MRALEDAAAAGGTGADAGAGAADPGSCLSGVKLAVLRAAREGAPAGASQEMLYVDAADVLRCGV